MTDLKPCPFPDCGCALGEEPAVSYITAYDQPGFQVLCPFCGARGPLVPDEAGARDYWNTRAPDRFVDGLRAALEPIPVEPTDCTEMQAAYWRVGWDCARNAIKARIEEEEGK